MSKLIVVSAPSGAGKTTLCQRLLKDFPNLTLSISSTTRKPRGDEKNGREYFFYTVEEFKHKIEDGEFAEWAEVHGNYYGTSKKVIKNAFAAQKSVLLDIDVQGAESLTRGYPGICHSFFIEPPSLEILEQRLRARKTDNEETIQKRIINARRELDQASRFDRVIKNDDLERAYNELKRYIEEIFGQV